jgi:hypothetical protein
MSTTSDDTIMKGKSDDNPPRNDEIIRINSQMKTRYKKKAATATGNTAAYLSPLRMGRLVVGVVELSISDKKRHNARHHPPAGMIDDNSHAIAGRVHAVVMVPIDAISQPALRPLAITHLASHVQEHQSLRSSITPGITRPPERLKIRAALKRVGCMPLLWCPLMISLNLPHASRQ